MSIAQCNKCGMPVDTDNVECMIQEYAQFDDEEMDTPRCHDCCASVYDMVERQGYK